LVELVLVLKAEIAMRQKKDRVSQKIQVWISLNQKTKIAIKNVEIRNYAKYILREGQIAEKRELLGCLSSRVTLANKVVGCA